MKERIKAFFEKYPNAPSLYQVGDQLFLIKYFKMADRLSKYTGKRDDDNPKS